MTEITWCKLFHDFADDVKFLRVSEIAGTTVELAQACWARAMCRASANSDRGSLATVDYEEFAWWFKKPAELIKTIFDTFERVARMVAGGRLANWAKRQGAAAALAASDVAKRPSRRAEIQKNYRGRKQAEAAEARLAREHSEPRLPFSEVTPLPESGNALPTDKDKESDQESPPVGPPRGARLAGRLGGERGRQVEILMPIAGGKDGRARYQTAKERRARERLEAGDRVLAETAMAYRLAAARAAACVG